MTVRMGYAMNDEGTPRTHLVEGVSEDEEVQPTRTVPVRARFPRLARILGVVAVRKGRFNVIHECDDRYWVVPQQGPRMTQRLYKWHVLEGQVISMGLQEIRYLELRRPFKLVRNMLAYRWPWPRDYWSTLAYRAALRTEYDAILTMEEENCLLEEVITQFEGRRHSFLVVPVRCWLPVQIVWRLVRWQWACKQWWGRYRKPVARVGALGCIGLAVLLSPFVSPVVSLCSGTVFGVGSVWLLARKTLFRSQLKGFSRDPSSRIVRVLFRSTFGQQRYRALLEQFLRSEYNCHASESERLFRELLDAQAEFYQERLHLTELEGVALGISAIILLSVASLRF